MLKVDVAILPKDVTRMNLSNTVCIVLDIFRATTTIVTSLSNGCKTIVPVLCIEDARALANHIGPVLFAGERQSIRIDGCDLGNSPFEFSQEKVRNQTIIMTTTNGTVAIKATEGAYRTLIGSFLNATAVCQQAKGYGKDILIVCAGTEGFFSLEDTLCAGLLVRLLTEMGEVELSDAARGALLMYSQAKDQLIETAVESRNGKRLYDLNRMYDIVYCFQKDRLNIVPEYREGKILLAK
ncbi:2-phosphosulfolactate phosphatase [Desulforamulus aeronauticus]|uniref:Probable 2-phosphosulfolactate phosphatase n=1 Tax=Desulforamulus aeronauticus DSM 10349 TaxID=1121421 RepID=A0A1M6W0J1_9FIRM|nr:2-phosphosulfolactate phosphatase [Desulforamulus aeronauticus]SHK87065.1 2-phosphosulfolactate phosphatase [Desulforamulus aeronauticus DSM 10349]